LLAGASAALALGGAELASRWLQPIQLHALIAADGRRLESWLAPGTAYRQVSSEYDARTTITPEGHRVPAPRGPVEVVFLGDSFTFGTGLADEETFAWQYCERTARSCANLAEPGSGTLRQVERLREFLDGRGWRPREVKLFVFAMTASFSAGNDLQDNYDAAAAGEPAPAVGGAGWLERALRLRGALERHSNLVRLAKYHWGPLLRSALLPRLDQARRERALALTRDALETLAALGERNGFALSMYLIHPVQDLRNGTYRETLAALAAIAPVPVRPTAERLAGDPARYYFPLDGHLNPRGARAIAQLLLEEPR
jgi:lysophospholipase L1-like esterase